MVLRIGYSIASHHRHRQSVLVGSRYQTTHTADLTVSTRRRPWVLSQPVVKFDVRMPSQPSGVRTRKYAQSELVILLSVDGGKVLLRDPHVFPHKSTEMGWARTPVVRAQLFAQLRLFCCTFHTVGVQYSQKLTMKPGKPPAGPGPRLY
jgi:hypothetical protein